MIARKLPITGLWLLLGVGLTLGVLGLGWHWLYRGSLSIEAQIIYNMGGPQPIARQTFYLLDSDPFALRADDPKVKLQYEKASSETARQVIALAGAQLLVLQEGIKSGKLNNENAKQFLGMVTLSRPYWEGHLVQAIETDFNGKGILKDIRPGNYWLLGQTETRSAFALWNLPVKIGFGENKLLLDQNNSMYSK